MLQTFVKLRTSRKKWKISDFTSQKTSRWSYILNDAFFEQKLQQVRCFLRRNDAVNVRALRDRSLRVNNPASRVFWVALRISKSFGSTSSRTIPTESSKVDYLPETNQLFTPAKYNCWTYLLFMILQITDVLLMAKVAAERRETLTIRGRKGNVQTSINENWRSQEFGFKAWRIINWAEKCTEIKKIFGLNNTLIHRFGNNCLFLTIILQLQLVQK